MRLDLAVVVQLVIASIVQALNEGDVQLKDFEVTHVDGDNPPFDGVLQVYYQGKWNTVCYDESSEATATVVCRQLGYINYNTYDPSDSYDSSLSVINGINCPVVMTPTEAEILFILRCKVGEVVPSGGCDRLSVTCDKTKYFYNGQVRIHHRNDYDSSVALLEINLEEDWRPICISTADGMSKSVADSACRQMGYTQANSSNPSKKFNKRSWKVDINSRCNYSFSPCFTDCINHYTAVDNCADNDENMYDLHCFFDKYFQVLSSSGTEKLCRYSSESIDVRFYSVTGALSFVVFVLSIVVFVQCFRHRCRRRPPAAAGDNPAPQPNIVVRWWKDRGGGYGGVHEQRED